jgi:type VI protein secretion system component VasA
MEVKAKKIQRVIPSDINVKSDLHRLKIILSREDVLFSSVELLKKRYSGILEKASQQKKVSNRISTVDLESFGLMEKDGLFEFIKGNCCPTKLKPVV